VKTSALLALVIAGFLILAAAVPSQASVHWRGGVYVGVGPWWGPPYWGPPYPYWWYPPPYYYPPTVIIEQPPVYIEQPPAAPPPPPAPPAYWYYCMSASAYYPSVQTCPEEWVKVPARP
jgi:hypothetical protein